MKTNISMPDYLFEVSWEVCNKVGGIHTVLATKALNLNEELKDKHIHILIIILLFVKMLSKMIMTMVELNWIVII